MCGIVGYTGKKEAKELLLHALELLEYRGYDSAGIAVFGEESEADGSEFRADGRECERNGSEFGADSGKSGETACESGATEALSGKVRIYKCAGRVKALKELCEGKRMASTCGIGHTRWATHGGVSDANAHPHRFGRVTVVHNGIIENYRELSARYGLEGRLLSGTDSEVAAAVLSHFYTGDPYAAIRKTVLKLKGTYALAILFEDIPGRIYAVRNVSPIVLARTPEGSALASDVTVIGQYAREYFVLPECHVAALAPDNIQLFDLSGEPVEPEWLTVSWEVDESGKGGYPFYMEKEIMEQPEAIEKTMESRIRDGLPDFAKDGVPDRLLFTCEKVCIVACGTAMHAGLVGKMLLQTLLLMPVEVELASEFIYREKLVDDKTLVIAISQSGETIDTLEALKCARKKGAGSLSIVNVRGSSIARESEYVLYTEAGPEIAVASTKAYTTQLTALYLLAGRMAYVRGSLKREQAVAFMEELRRVPQVVRQVLESRQKIHSIARRLLNAKDVFMIGRGLDYSILLEGSLKLKEVSYIHSEAYASGELKHGTIALITQDTPVVAVVTQKKLFFKELSNIKEVQSRGAGVILFWKETLPLDGVGEPWECEFALPALEDVFMVMPASVALQLLAYYVSSDKGLDVDKPRNLAKVVTVE